MDNIYAEDLPEKCPPENASDPIGDKFYRVVKSYPPTESDFYSQYKKKPHRPFSNLCIAKALSIYQTPRECDNIIKTTNEYRNCKIVSLVLNPQSGPVLQDSKVNGSTHHSWWMRKYFDPTQVCELIDSF